MTQNY